MELLIAAFVDYLKFEKRYSEHTVRSYHDDLAAFSQFIHRQFGDAPVGEISSAMVRSWLADLKGHAIGSRSINRKISVLKSFFKFLLRTGQLENTPMNPIISPKINKRLPVFVEQKDIQALFSRVEFPDSWKGRTDRLLLELFYHTGMRLSELVNIRDNQVDLGHRTIKVLGKGSKERVIPISPAMATGIGAYREAKTKELTAFDPVFLLVGRQGKKLYPKYVYLCVRGYLGQVTTLEKKSPHVLRHTFATHLTNGGAELHSVKELLGHASLAATQVYTHNTIEKLKDIHKKAHPRG